MNPSSVFFFHLWKRFQSTKISKLKQPSGEQIKKASVRRERALNWASKDCCCPWKSVAATATMHETRKKMRNLFRALIIILSVMWADDFYSYVECGVGELFLSHWSNDERHLLHRLLLIFFYLATKKVKTKQTFSIFLRTQKVSRAVGKKYKCQSQTNS